MWLILKFLNFPLINCEIDLDLLWSKECVVSEISITPRIPANSDANSPVQEVVAVQTTIATFQINKTKLYVPVAFFLLMIISNF